MHPAEPLLQCFALGRKKKLAAVLIYAVKSTNSENLTARSRHDMKQAVGILTEAHSYSTGSKSNMYMTAATAQRKCASGRNPKETCRP